MDTEQYRDLLHELSFACNLAEEEDELLQTTGCIQINDVFFYVLDDVEGESGEVFVYCMFGVPPPDREADVLRVLLQENMGMFSYSGPTFMLSSEDHNVVLAYRYTLAEMTPQHLLEVFESVSQEALKWRQTFYLGEASDRVTDPSTDAFSHDFV